MKEPIPNKYIPVTRIFRRKALRVFVSTTSRDHKRIIRANPDLNKHRKFVNLAKTEAVVILTAALKKGRSGWFKKHKMTSAKAIITTDKADDQTMHRDCEDEGNVTVVVALTQRKIEFEIGGEIEMNAGDMLLFQSELKHKGKATTTSEDTVGIILNYALPNSELVQK